MDSMKRNRMRNKQSIDTADDMTEGNLTNRMNLFKSSSMIGLYFKSVESLTNKKWILYFLTVWTKIVVIVTPIYLGSAIKYLIFDEGPLTLKMAVFRRVFAFSTCFLKCVFFYAYRQRIETLIDLWDSYFQEELYSEDLKDKLKKNQKQNVKILSLSWLITLGASSTYAVPQFFSPTKSLSHPSGIPYRHRSPDFELMVIFDFGRVVMGCLSAVSVDCILMVLLSLVKVHLTHLRDSLTDMIKAISVNARGEVEYRNRRGREETSDSAVRSRINKKQPLRFLAKNEPVHEYGESVREFDAKMRIWILHHQQTIKFFDAVKTIFTPITSLQLIYVVFYTCFTAFHLARAKMGIDVVVIPFIASSNLISLFVWCQIGVQMHSISSSIFTDAFGEAWYLFPRKIQTVLSFVIVRGWKPLILRGLSLFDLDLFTFFQVVKITYQLFAFLMQVSSEQ